MVVSLRAKRFPVRAAHVPGQRPVPIGDIHLCLPGGLLFLFRLCQPLSIRVDTGWCFVTPFGQWDAQSLAGGGKAPSHLAPSQSEGWQGPRGLPAGLSLP